LLSDVRSALQWCPRAGIRGRGRVSRYMTVAVSALDAGCAPHIGCLAADRDRIQAPLLTPSPFGQGKLSILTGRRVKERDARLQQYDRRANRCDRPE